MKRKVPLLAFDKQMDYVSLLHRAFLGNRELRVSLRNALPDSRFRKLASSLFFQRDSQATDLDLYQWIALFHEVNAGL